jgi:ketosteroid isomerase-like protein
MKRRVFAVTTLLALMGVWIVSLAYAQDAAVRKEIEAQYVLLAQAAEKGDLDAFAKMMRPDFKHVDLLGKEATKDQWFAELQTTFGGIEGLKATPTVSAVTVTGEVVVPVVSIKMTGTMMQDGKSVPVEISLAYRDTWEKAADGWKWKQAKLVLQNTRIDKKTVKAPFTPEAEEVRKALQPLYDAISDIYAKRDWTTLEKIIPENPNSTDAAGTQLTKKELLDRIKNAAKNLNDPIMSISIQQIGMDSANAKIVRVMTLLADATLLDGTKGRLRYVNVTRDHWTKMEKNWAMKSSAELHSEAYLDGKPIPLAAFGGK